MPEDTKSADLLEAARVELHELLLETTEIGDFLDSLSALAAATADGDVSCGITLIRDGRPSTVTNSDARASQLDEIQYSKGDGPCLQSARTGKVVRVADFGADDRWDGFPSRAVAHGVRSSLSLPLIAGADSVGALNLYASAPSSFNDEEERQGLQFAGEAARALALALRLSDQAEMTHHMQMALASRSTIDQALGILMAQNRCNADQAFAILRDASHHRNVKLRDVAADVVTSVSGEPLRRPPQFR